MAETEHEGVARPRVLILGYTGFVGNPRQLKQIALLKHGVDLTTAGFGPAPDPDVEHIELESMPPRTGAWAIPGIPSLLVYGRLHWLRSRLLPLTRATVRRLRRGDWDLIICHDEEPYPAAELLRPRRGVVVDLHEFAPRQRAETDRTWRLVDGPYVRWLVRRMGRRAAGATTVGAGIARLYRDDFGLDAEVVTNATPFARLEPLPVGQPIRLVHSGLGARNRDIGAMIEAVRRTTADVELDLYLTSEGGTYLAELREQIRDLPRVRLLDPVPYDELVPTLARYDVGLAVIPSTTFSYRWSLPNKFFDYVQARLGVVTLPSPEMATLVGQHGFGAVAEDWTVEALTAVLDGLTVERVAAWKAASHRHARELSAEVQVEIWRRMLDRLLAAPSPR